MLFIFQLHWPADLWRCFDGELDTPCRTKTVMTQVNPCPGKNLSLPRAASPASILHIIHMEPASFKVPFADDGVVSTEQLDVSLLLRLHDVRLSVKVFLSQSSYSG